MTRLSSAAISTARGAPVALGGLRLRGLLAELRRGDAYGATVSTPNPNGRERRAARFPDPPLHVVGDRAVGGLLDVPAGAVERKQLGATVASVDVSRVQEQVPVADISSVLSSRVAGLRSINPTGGAGAGKDLRIRGTSSLYF